MDNYVGYDITDTSSIEDLINTAIKLNIKNMVNTSFIAKVTKVDGNKVDLETLHGKKIINVLVAFSGFGAWTISAPIKSGDYGLVLFTKYEFSDYKEKGIFKGEEQGFTSINNGIFIPFSLYNQPDIKEDIILENKQTNTKIKIDNKGAISLETNSQIEIKGATVSFCGATAVQGVISMDSPCPLTGKHSKGSSRVFASGI